MISDRYAVHSGLPIYVGVEAILIGYALATDDILYVSKVGCERAKVEVRSSDILPLQVHAEQAVAITRAALA